MVGGEESDCNKRSTPTPSPSAQTHTPSLPRGGGNYSFKLVKKRSQGFRRKILNGIHSKSYFRRRRNYCEGIKFNVTIQSNFEQRMGGGGGGWGVDDRKKRP